MYARSLLASEALEDDLGVAVDSEVVNGSGVGRRSTSAVGAAGDAADGSRAQSCSGNGLHYETMGTVATRKRTKRKGDERLWGRKRDRERSFLGDELELWARENGCPLRGLFSGATGQAVVDFSDGFRARPVSVGDGRTWFGRDGESVF